MDILSQETKTSLHFALLMNWARSRLLRFVRFQYNKECVMDCEDAMERGRELRADNKLIAKALSVSSRVPSF